MQGSLQGLSTSLGPPWVSQGKSLWMRQKVSLSQDILLLQHHPSEAPSTWNELLQGSVWTGCFLHQNVVVGCEKFLASSELLECWIGCGMD